MVQLMVKGVMMSNENGKQERLRRLRELLAIWQRKLAEAKNAADREDAETNLCSLYEEIEKLEDENA